MIAIINYDAGNLRSVENALDRLGCEYVLTDDPATILAADKVILPGVGNAAHAMESLESKGLVPVIRSIRRPVLGICVGLQIMCRDSEEGPCSCMGIFDSHVRRFPQNPDAKVPHMGWNCIGNLESKLFKGPGASKDGKTRDEANEIASGSYVYFVHSYYPTLCPDTIATCKHGDMLFSAALKYENFYGTQFHPEKSGSVGEQILKNFIGL